MAVYDESHEIRAAAEKEYAINRTQCADPAAPIDAAVLPHDLQHNLLADLLVTLQFTEQDLPDSQPDCELLLQNKQAVTA